jgi:DMSO/TMAO reductase YedYZ heme-binding membrane subunit
MTAPLPAPSPVQDRLQHDLLTLAYPAFTITCHHHTWRKPRWEAVRKNTADPGLYAIVTPDLAELAAALAATITTPRRQPERRTREHLQPAPPRCPGRPGA